MFEEARAVFLYCVSPVHMGAGTAIGMIDNPIQRERHTDYPTMAGSGLKGAVRHQVVASGAEESLVNRIFGPAVQASDHAGAISFGDAQLVAFPVRSLKRAFVYATSPTALARTERALRMTGLPLDWTTGADPGGNRCRVASGHLLINGSLTLESFQFEGSEDSSLRGIGEWLAKNALPKSPGNGQDGHPFFRDKLKNDLVLLSDEDFGFFVRNATIVEPHVRINDVSGTADEGGLFYTENLPPETLLLTLLMASQERKQEASGKDNGGVKKLAAKEVMDLVLKGKAETGNASWPWALDGALLQVGGDATTGRGLMLARAVTAKPGKEN